MTFCLRETSYMRYLVKPPTFSLRHSTSTFRLSSSVRNMNTLQEASTIYKAFKKGGPAFGGWQVRNQTSSSTLFILIRVIRCFLERTIPERLLVQASIGFVSTVNTVI